MKTLSINEALISLEQGGIIAYPTETFYGLGADPHNETALGKIFSIKERDRGKPVSILISGVSELAMWTNEVSKDAHKLIEYFWPGPLTLIFKARPTVSNLLTAGTGTIAIRISSHPIAHALCQKNGAITTTSANLSGTSSCLSPKEVDEQIGGRIEGCLKEEVLPPSSGSTILDVTRTTFKVIRAGEISSSDIQKQLNTRLS